MRVHLQVLQGDPAQPEASVDSMTAITDLYTLWALPAKMDLVEDFGLSESDAAGLEAAGIDPKNFNPASLAGLDIAALLKQYPQLEALLAMYGIDPSMLATLDPETIKKGLEAYMASGGTIPNLPGGGASGGSNNGADAGGNGNNNNSNDNHRRLVRHERGRQDARCRRQGRRRGLHPRPRARAEQQGRRGVR